MKFSIVSPTYNAEKYIAETIESVISQKGDFEIEYIIVDNCSTDNTIKIVKEYESLIREGSPIVKCNKVTMQWVSKRDRGMYDAINNGFGMAAGDILAWVNSSDYYFPGAFDIVRKTFSEFPQVKWLAGITSYINTSSNIFNAGKCYLYDQSWIQKGIYGRAFYFIDQAGSFWHSDLWKRIGGIDPDLKLAGDYYLWFQFAKLEKLYSLKVPVSCFRFHDGQLSQNMPSYQEECKRIISTSYGLLEKKIRYFMKMEYKIPRTFHRLLYRLMFPGQDLNLIELRNNDIVMTKRNYYLGN